MPRRKAIDPGVAGLAKFAALCEQKAAKRERTRIAKMLRDRAAELRRKAESGKLTMKGEELAYEDAGTLDAVAAWIGRSAPRKKK